MTTMPRFPNIPEVEDGQIIGATHLNSLARACEHLLGLSHASYTLPYATAVLSTLEDAYTELATYWMYHAAALVAYWFIGGQTSAGKTWYIQLQYYGDDAAWHTVQTWSDTASPSAQVGTLDLSAEANITVGKVYQWRWLAKTSDETYYTTLQVRYFATRTAVAGWVAPPAIAAGASSAAALNTYRNNLVALNAGVVPSVNPLGMCEDQKEHTDPQDDWVAYTQWAYRYRPNGLYVGVWGKIMGGHWGWRVKFADAAGNQATIYSVDDIPASADWTKQAVDLDLTTGGVATALSAAGITLTLGAGYLVILEAKRQSDDWRLYLDYAMCVRTSDGTPGGSWADNKLWAHLNQDVGPTQLNKVRTDMLELYTGGAEELWGDHHASHYHDGDNTYAGVHLKRYLVYYAVEGEQPTLLYGADYAEEYGLPACTAGAGAEWRSFVPSEAGVALGSYYLVDDVGAAFEMDGEPD